MKARLFLLLATAGIVLAVFPWGDFQGHTHWAKVGWIPFVSQPVRVRDIIANVLLFVPFGAAVAVNTRRAPVLSATLAGATLSFVGEATQLYSHARFPSATDVVTNTAGAALAALLMARHLQQRRAAAAEAPYH
jgi:glycopeptide antibiotics resistance protein